MVPLASFIRDVQGSISHKGLLVIKKIKKTGKHSFRYGIIQLIPPKKNIQFQSQHKIEKENLMNGHDGIPV